MDDIIQRIIDIEKKAQSIVSEAREEKRVYEQTMQAEIESFRGKISDEYVKKAGAYSARMKAEADAGVKRAEEDVKQKIAQMRETAARKKSEWIELLAQKIINGEF